MSGTLDIDPDGNVSLSVLIQVSYPESDQGPRSGITEWPLSYRTDPHLDTVLQDHLQPVMHQRMVGTSC